MMQERRERDKWEWKCEREDGGERRRWGDGREKKKRRSGDGEKIQKRRRESRRWDD